MVSRKLRSEVRRRRHWPIVGSALGGLTGALERRKMISHVWFVTLCANEISGDRRILDYMGVNTAGQTFASPLTPPRRGYALCNVVTCLLGMRIPAVPISSIILFCSEVAELFVFQETE